MLNKLRHTFFLFVVLTFNGYSQSLSINETIAYLNKLSTEHPGKGYYESNTDAIINAGSDCELKIVYNLVLTPY